MINIRYPKFLIVLNVLALSAVLISQISIPAHAQSQTLSASDLKSIDDFFNSSENFSSSDCDRETWNMMHQAARTMYSSDLPPSNVHDDIVRAEQIRKCELKADKAAMNLMLNIGRLNQSNKKEIATLENLYSNPDAQASVRAISDIESNTTKHILFLDWYLTQRTISQFADSASRMYSQHADDTKYKNLVERYNALTDSLANVRLAQGSSFPIQPRPLHCEAKTDFLGVTRMDCE